jgi:uncharacterized membrane protein YkoI
MKSKSLIVAFLSIALVTSGYYVIYAQGPEQEDYQNEVTVRHVVEILDPASLDLNISAVEAENIAEGISGRQINKPTVSLIRDNKYDLICWNISWDNNLIDIDADTGSVTGISLPGTYNSEPGIVNLKNANEIGESKLEELGMSQLETQAVNVSLENQDGKELYKVVWSHVIDEIPIEDSFVSILLDPSGNIIQYKNRWHVIDIDTNALITAEEAVDIAKENVASLELPDILMERVNDVTDIYAKLVIKKPLNILDDHKPRFEEWGLIWEVTFERNFEDVTNYLQISIDAKSGEWVGTDYSK